MITILRLAGFGLLGLVIGYFTGAISCHFVVRGWSFSNAFAAVIGGLIVTYVIQLGLASLWQHEYAIPILGTCWMVGCLVGVVLIVRDAQANLFRQGQEIKKADR